MAQIWKFDLHFGSSVIQLPENSTILYTGVQDGVIRIWAKVNPFGGLYNEREFVIYGTGQMIPDDVELKHIGTVELQGCIFHVFEKLK